MQDGAVDELEAAQEAPEALAVQELGVDRVDQIELVLVSVFCLVGRPN